MTDLAHLPIDHGSNRFTERAAVRCVTCGSGTALVLRAGRFVCRECVG